MKNIVICCDGTGNEYGKNNTNVVETCTLALKNDDQFVFYDPGVGTGGWKYVEEEGKLTALSDQATGSGLQKNVEDAYRYLMAYYDEGDRIYLFGFSRGVFTARSLAGMLYKCGLLRLGSENLLEFASKVYNTDGNDEIAAGFKVTFGRPCPVYFIGVWDTVESLAMNAGKKFYDARLNPETSYGYHALAIDERRRDFLPNLWKDTAAVPGQTIEQVWFAGGHANVGGWYDERGLSNIALRWMLQKADACQMKIDMDRLMQGERYTPNPHDKLYDEASRGFWRWRGRRTRKIPENSRIHESVLQRKERTSNKYKPKGLPDKYDVVEA